MFLQWDTCNIIFQNQPIRLPIQLLMQMFSMPLPFISAFIVRFRCCRHAKSSLGSRIHRNWTYRRHISRRSNPHIIPYHVKLTAVQRANRKRLWYRWNPSNSGSGKKMILIHRYKWRGPDESLSLWRLVTGTWGFKHYLVSTPILVNLICMFVWNIRIWMLTIALEFYFKPRAIYSWQPYSLLL